MREYLNKPIEAEIYTVKEFNEQVNNNVIKFDDGSGYWMKDGMESNDEVFINQQLDATHVAWYNK